MPPRLLSSGRATPASKRLTCKPAKARSRIPSIETCRPICSAGQILDHVGGCRPAESRGRVYLSGPNPADPVRIDANLLSHPDDVRAALAGVELCREVGNARALRSFARREVMPGSLKGLELQNFIRNGAITYWHQSGTAAMGRDAMSVVDGELRVFGPKNNFRSRTPPITAPRDNRQHDGAMRCHRRARRRDSEDSPTAFERGFRNADALMGPSVLVGTRGDAPQPCPTLASRQYLVVVARTRRARGRGLADRRADRMVSTRRGWKASSVAAVFPTPSGVPAQEPT